MKRSRQRDQIMKYVTVEVKEEGRMKGRNERYSTY
jgi:hypothetical protein